MRGDKEADLSLRLWPAVIEERPSEKKPSLGCCSRSSSIEVGMIGRSARAASALGKALHCATKDGHTS